MRDQMLARRRRGVRVAAVGVAVGAALSGAIVTTPAIAAPYPPVPPTVSAGGGGAVAVDPGGQFASSGTRLGTPAPAAQPYRGGIAVDPGSVPVQAQTGSGPSQGGVDEFEVSLAILGVGVAVSAAAGAVVVRRRRA